MIVDLRLAIPAAVVWLTAGLGLAAPDSAALVPVMAAMWLAAGVLLAAALVLRESPVRGAPRWAAALLVAALASGTGGAVLTVMAVRLEERSPPELRAVVEARRPAMIDLRITGRPTKDRVAATIVEVTAVSEPEPEPEPEPEREPGVETETGAAGAGHLAVPALVFGGELRTARIGELWRARATLRAAEPGDDRAVLAFAEGRAMRLRAPPPLLDGASSLRAGFLQAATALPGDGGRLLPGLAIGDTSAVDHRLDADLRASSLSHLTAVSGANCAVLVALVMLGGRALGVRREVRVAVSAIVLTGFVVLVTPEPSVLRAGVMALLVLMALGLGRPVRGIPLLSAATVLLLMVDPWLSRSVGFALSVLATGALLVLAAPLAGALRRIMPGPLAVAVSVPAAAQLACQPLIVLLDPAIPLQGIAANLLAGPAAPIATVVGLAACLLLPLAPVLAELLVQVAAVPASWIAAVAHVSADLPAARLPWLPGLVGLLSLVVVTGLLLWAVLTRPGARGRRAAGSAVVLVLVGGLGTAVGTQLGTALGRHAAWQFAVCDVGQGDALLVRDRGQVALIDTGPEPAPLAGCLDELGIEQLDLLVLTHYDLDHVGGVEAVVGRADRVLTGPADGAEDERIARRLAAAGARVDRVARGERGRIGALDWEVLWPPDHGVVPGNDASVVLRVTPGRDCRCLSALLLGDLGAESQLRLLGAVPVGPVDVVKVAHHGSADQSAELYARLEATVGVIGVGENGYGHPTSTLLDVLDATGTVPARTDERGLILLARADGDAGGGVQMWSGRDPPVGDGGGG